ncbi:MAG: DUF2288 domain-containing protein [Gammaproteobacteria bacterium]|nr:DUF2288 domain-containing protein [Gammaproteobacteria bacterium]MBU1725766.1 DUF2288 domain-containing protein [Gammaproteobacteria bacterium]MBU2006950.1 DUF2288 domain-containing protein [Gammaproteobacteria bacterium]
MEEELLPLHTRMNLETARIAWPELERHFAGGRVILVAPELDLVDVATCMAKDDSKQLKSWMDAQQVGQLSDEKATCWVNEQPENLWAVVVAPWVLVQERNEA